LTEQYTPGASPTTPTPGSPNGNATNLDKEWADAGQGLSILSSFIGTIKNAYFTTSGEEYKTDSAPANEGQGRQDNDVEQAIDPPDFPFEEAKIRLSCGKAENWNIVSGGEEVVAKKGGFAGSKYSKWIKQATEVVKIPIASRRMSPNFAKVWQGLRVHVENVEETMAKPFTTQDGKVITTTRTWMIQQWLQDEVPPLA
jgi:hypothetical protein